MGCRTATGLNLSLAGATRNLWPAHPPVDTPVTWCPYHHRGYVPKYPGDKGASATDVLRTGDYDLVLYCGTAACAGVTSRQDAQRYTVPATDPSRPTPGGRAIR